LLSAYSRSMGIRFARASALPSIAAMLRAGVNAQSAVMKPGAEILNAEDMTVKGLVSRQAMRMVQSVNGYIRPPLQFTSVAVRALSALLALSCVINMPTLARGQSQSFPPPKASGILGQRDAGALAEITSHLHVVGAIAWNDLEATGTLSYQDGDTHPVSLYLQGSGYSRLDIDMGSGTRSVRLDGSSGTFQDESGNQSYLPPATARAGILAFPRVWAEARTSPLVSLIDLGTYTVSGQSLHRISMEYRRDPGGLKAGDPTVATDLYFDPGTHLLVFSVDSVQFAGIQRHSFLQVIAYAGYQSFNGVLVPTELQQTLDDQPQWAVRLSQINLNTNLPSKTFSF
jgi:hypothetical protein